MPVIGHKKYFCVQSESSFFRVTFVTSYSKVFADKLFDRSPVRLFAICLLVCPVQLSFPRSRSATERRTMKPKKISKFSMFVIKPEKASTEKIRLWTNRRYFRELQSTIIFEASLCTWAIFVRVVSLVSAHYILFAVKALL